MVVPTEVPTHWYNLAADLPEPTPPALHPGTREPLGPDDLAPLFPMALIMQEVATERWIEIPEPVRDIYRLWRPSPLIRAHRLEKAWPRRPGSSTSGGGGRRGGGGGSTRSGRGRRIFGCAGGGSNLAGLSFPFLGRNLRSGTATEVVACEPSACPSLTQGVYRYDFGDVAGLTPLLKMHTLGNDFVPPPIHAGGLRYHGMAPMVSHAVNLGLMSAVAVDQADAFKAGVEFARAEGLIPAPESTHAVAAAIDRARAATTEETIVLGLSGNGVLDLPAYADFV